MRLNKISSFVLAFIVTVTASLLVPQTAYSIDTNVASINDTTEVESIKTVASNETFSSNRLSINGNTAIAVSQEGWPNGARAVVIARDDDFPDALTGAPLAFRYDAPMLLTNKNFLSHDVECEIDRLNPETAYILGATGAVSQNIEDQLTSKGINVVRIQGENRYETAVKIAEQVGSTNGEAVIANGNNYPDALAISSWAAVNGIPILLTSTNAIPVETQRAIQEQHITETYIVGGKSVISDVVANKLPNVNRYAGANRYGTAINILQNLDRDVSFLYVAAGTNFKDALVGSILAAKNQSMVVLVDNQLSDKAVSKFFADNKGKINYLGILGTTNNVPDTAINKIKELADENVANKELLDAVTSDSTFYVSNYVKPDTTWAEIRVSKEDKINGEVRYRQVTWVVKAENSQIREKIYLPFGPGTYSIGIWETSWDAGDNPRGNLIGRYSSYFTFILRNTDIRDHEYLFPSQCAQSDAPEIIDLALKITDGITDDLQKSKAIHDWIARNIAYDTEAYFSHHKKSETSVDILNTKMAVCTGYVNLTAALHRAIGIKAKIVSGFAKTAEQTWQETYANIGMHAWNEIFIDGQWMPMDTTWDAGYINTNKQFQFNYRDTYFNPDPTIFAENRQLDQYQLYN